MTSPQEALQKAREQNSAPLLAPRELGDGGKCCGRKPLFYRTRRGLKSEHDPHHFCPKCDAEFGVDGKQRANWAYEAIGSNFAPKYPEAGYWRLVSEVVHTPAPSSSEAQP